MVKLLSLDLGLTTGYCIQSPKGHIFQLGILEYESEKQFEAMLTHLLTANLPNKYVVEAPVILRGPLGDKLTSVVAATKRVLRQGGDWIEPSQWKGSPEGKLKVPVDYKITPHERDAYRMGQWWLKTHGA